MSLFQYQGLAEPVSQSGENITPDKWTPCNVPPQANWRRAASYSLAALVAVTVLGDIPRAEAVSIDRWHPAIEQPQLNLKRQQYTFPSAGSLDPFPRTVTEVVTLDKWYRETERPRWDVRRNQHLYPATVLGDVLRAESITIDKWYAEPQRPRWDKARNQYLYPPFSWHSETPPPPVGGPLKMLALLGVGQ